MKTTAKILPHFGLSELKWTWQTTFDSHHKHRSLTCLCVGAAWSYALSFCHNIHVRHYRLLQFDTSRRDHHFQWQFFISRLMSNPLTVEYNKKRRSPKILDRSNIRLSVLNDFLILRKLLVHKIYCMQSLCYSLCSNSQIPKYSTDSPLMQMHFAHVSHWSLYIYFLLMMILRHAAKQIYKKKTPHILYYNITFFCTYFFLRSYFIFCTCWNQRSSSKVLGAPPPTK